MPRKEMHCDRPMGGEMTRITILGALVIVVAAVMTIIVIRALTKETDDGAGRD